MTSLTVAAGLGDMALGNLSAGGEINTFTVTSGDEITLNDLSVEGNTVSLNVSGDINVNGIIQGSAGSVSLITSGGSIELTQDVASNGTLSLTANAGTLNTQGLSSGGGLNVSAGWNEDFLPK
jgi:hypothetical protein